MNEKIAPSHLWTSNGPSIVVWHAKACYSRPYIYQLLYLRSRLQKSSSKSDEIWPTYGVTVFGILSDILNFKRSDPLYSSLSSYVILQRTLLRSSTIYPEPNDTSLAEIRRDLTSLLECARSHFVKMLYFESFCMTIMHRVQVTVEWYL